MRRTTPVLAALALLVAACGDGAPDGAPDRADALLQTSDLSGVSSTRDRDNGTGVVGGCGAFNAKESVLGKDSVMRTFKLDDGDVVTSARISTDGTRSSASGIVDEMAATIDDCVGRTDDADTVTRLDLADGSTGYRSITETSNGPRLVDRGYGAVEPDHVVIVTVEHFGDGQPVASVKDLLAVAVDRAALR